MTVRGRPHGREGNMDEAIEGIPEPGPEPVPDLSEGVPLDPEENWIYDLGGSGLVIQEVAGKVLGLTEYDSGHLTRRFIKPTITPGGDDGTTTVEIDVHHQKRRNSGVPYSPLDLRTMRGGDWTHVPMDSAETLRLFKHLEALYAIGATGVTRFPRKLRVVDADEVTISGPLADVIRKLREEHGDADLSAHLENLAPDLIGTIALKIEHARRVEALGEFSVHMRPEPDGTEWTEPQWKDFFKRNEWIFGHNLDFQYLHDELPEAYVGGRRPSGGGSQLADHVMGTGGDWSFAVLVEIKKPNTPLLGAYYREGAYKIHHELSNAVAQAQSNCQALIRMSSTAEGAREFDPRALTVADPRGIVLIGDLTRFEEPAQRETFQRFRHNLWNPTVMTYDELLNRAKFQVARTAPPETARLAAATAARAPRGRPDPATATATGRPFSEEPFRIVIDGTGLRDPEPEWGPARRAAEPMRDPEPLLESEPDPENRGLDHDYRATWNARDQEEDREPDDDEEPEGEEDDHEDEEVGERPIRYAPAPAPRPANDADLDDLPF
jgi:hypothetical protein